MARPYVDDFIGDEYYVDAFGGSDLNTGTSDSDAWQTIGYAINTGIPAVGYNTTNGVRLNIKSNADHSITTSLTSGGNLYTKLNGGSAWNKVSGFIIQGYTSTANDGGVGTIVNNCGTSTRFIDDSTSDYWCMADVHCKFGTSSRLFQADRNCLFMDCAFTGTTTNNDVIYTDRETDFYRCYFEFGGSMRYDMSFRDCVMVSDGTYSIVNDRRTYLSSCLCIHYGSANKTYLARCGAGSSAFVNVGTGTVTYGVQTETSVVGCYFENVTTPIHNSYRARRYAGNYRDNYEYGCTNQAVVFSTGTSNSGHATIYEDVKTVTSSPFASIDETGFTLADGSEILYDHTIGTSNGDGWSGIVKRYAGTGGIIVAGSTLKGVAGIERLK